MRPSPCSSQLYSLSDLEPICLSFLLLSFGQIIGAFFVNAGVFSHAVLQVSTQNVACASAPPSPMISMVMRLVATNGPTINLSTVNGKLPIQKMKSAIRHTNLNDLPTSLLQLYYYVHIYIYIHHVSRYYTSFLTMQVLIGPYLVNKYGDNETPHRSLTPIHRPHKLNQKSARELSELVSELTSLKHLCPSRGTAVTVSDWLEKGLRINFLLVWADSVPR